MTEPKTDAPLRPHGERVQQFFAAFLDEAKALVHHKLLNADEAGAIASAFARIAASMERESETATPMVYWSERDDNGEWQHYRATPEHAGTVLTERVAGRAAPLGPDNMVRAPNAGQPSGFAAKYALTMAGGYGETPNAGHAELARRLLSWSRNPSITNQFNTFRGLSEDLANAADALEGKSAQAKPICYGIVNAAGKMHTSESCISSDRESLSAEIEPLQEDEPDDGWKIVPFYAGTDERRGT